MSTQIETLLWLVKGTKLLTNLSLALTDSCEADRHEYIFQSTSFGEVTICGLAQNIYSLHSAKWRGTAHNGLGSYQPQTDVAG